jgi:hypothetical protein
MDIKAVITVTKPRIIWYTDAGVMVKAINISEEAVKSNAAGMASRRGLGFIFNYFWSAI